MKKDWYYDIYKITWMKNGEVMSSHAVDWCYKSLKEAREHCKKKYWSWPYYYIVRRINGKNGNRKYKP